MFEEAGHVNWIEFLWVVEGFAGILLSFISLWAANKDRKLVEETEINHGMEVIARTNIQTELFRLIPHLFVVSIGLIAWTYAPSPYPQNDLGWAITIMLFCIPLCAAVNSLNIIFTRRKLMNLHMKFN